jgi:hypothetical protein
MGRWSAVLVAALAMGEAGVRAEGPSGRGPDAVLDHTDHGWTSLLPDVVLTHGGPPHAPPSFTDAPRAPAAGRGPAGALAPSSPMPEPSGLAMAVSGLAALALVGAARRRRGRVAAVSPCEKSAVVENTGGS